MVHLIQLEHALMCVWWGAPLTARMAVLGISFMRWMSLPAIARRPSSSLSGFAAPLSLHELLVPLHDSASGPVTICVFSFRGTKVFLQAP